MTHVPAEADATRPAPDASPPAKPSRARRLGRWAVDLLILAAVFYGIRSWQARDVVDVGAPAPPLVVTTLDGAPFDLTDLRGDVVQLRFQATWCGACRREQGAVNRLVEGLGDDEHLVTVFDIEDRDTIRAYVDEAAIPGTIVVAGPRTQRDWGVSAFPTNVWVRPDGTVDSRSVGLTTRPVMRMHLDRARD